MSFPVHLLSGTVADLHGSTFLDEGRGVYVLEPTQRCAALGSTQALSVLDPGAVKAAGREVATRRSGGGLVVMNPGEMLWIDVVIPAGDPLWSHDVGRAFEWLGEVWKRALVAAGERATSGTFERYSGPLAHRALGKVVCFAGAGEGEVMDGVAKVVGMSQRRTREFARFQCMVHGRFDAADSVSLLSAQGLGATALSEAELTAHLDSVVSTVVDLDRLRRAFLEEIAAL